VMKCPRCVEEGKRSKVSVYLSTVTAMMPHTFYDEDGRHHVHDNNMRLTPCRCSNGHEWVHGERGKCWCGWKGGSDASVHVLG
jgi:hypothetical protein